MISPIFPKYFLFLACLGSLARAVTGACPSAIMPCDRSSSSGLECLLSPYRVTACLPTSILPAYQAAEQGSCQMHLMIISSAGDPGLGTFFLDLALCTCCCCRAGSCWQTIGCWILAELTLAYFCKQRRHRVSCISPFTNAKAALGDITNAAGVAGGATRAALTQHFAIKGNAADISAKEATQVTCLWSVSNLLIWIQLTLHRR